VQLTWSAESQSHMWESHRVTPREAKEAVTDVDAVWFEPDPASRSGLTSRVVGYSRSRRQVLCVIVLPVGGGYEGVNAWPANSTYRRLYREAQDDD
jgi:hypothetical protein